MEELDSKRHSLRLEDGKNLSYQRLLLATGATPQRPDMPGKALRGVQVLRSWEQAAALRKQEVEVTVVSPHPLPFEKPFGTELGTFFRRRHQEKGVTFVDGETAAFEGKKASAR